MKKIACISAIYTTLFMLCLMSIASAGLLDDILKGLGARETKEEQDVMDNSTIISGLKEALSISTQNAIKNVSKIDGYFGNEMIKILMPEKIQNVADVLRMVGFHKEVDEFILSMNRAAEKAAPEATAHFINAIKEISIADARGILNGGDTAATEYFRKKTRDKIYNSFRPIISLSLNQTGTTKAYKELIGRYESLPFVDRQSFDLDHYVTDKSLDGLFYMIAQEEKNIRKDPAARVTDLLKRVFGK